MEHKLRVGRPSKRKTKLIKKEAKKSDKKGCKRIPLKRSPKRLIKKGESKVDGTNSAE